MIKIRVGQHTFKVDKDVLRSRPSSMLCALVDFYEKNKNNRHSVNLRERNPDIFRDILRWYHGDPLVITSGYPLRSVLVEWDFWGIDPIHDSTCLHLAVLPEKWNSPDALRSNIIQLAESIVRFAIHTPTVLHAGHIMVLPTEGWFTFVNVSNTYESDINALQHDFVRQLLIFELCRRDIQASFVTHPPTCEQIPGHKTWTYALLDHWLQADGRDDRALKENTYANMATTECARCPSTCTRSNDGCWRSKERVKRATTCIDLNISKIVSKGVPPL